MSLNLIWAATNPIPCYALKAVTRGSFVKTVGQNDVVDSTGMSSFSNTELSVENADGATDYLSTIGIAGDTVSAGGQVPVYTEGLFIVRSSAGITVGNRVIKAASSDGFEVTAMTTRTGYKIGTALTGASAGDKYLIILLRTGT